LGIHVLIVATAKTGDFLAYLRSSRRMEVFSMEEEDTREYEVLVNGEEQYSLWLAGQAVPNGWRQVGPRGKKQVCLDYVKEVWTDMRPLSVRKAMEAHAKAQEEAKARQQAQAGTDGAATGAQTANAEATAHAASPDDEGPHTGEIQRPPPADNSGAGAATTA
jgi:MbtH protein